MRRIIIGVMGPGDGATDRDNKNAFELGKLIAQKGWILLSGGRNKGVMDSVSKGAKSAGGLTIGIIPTKDDAHTSDAIDISIKTGMGSARNYINILTSEVVIACGMGAGTASEISLALKANKNVILLNDMEESKMFFQKLNRNLAYVVDSPQEAIKKAYALLKKLNIL